jgi:dTMP kinase
MPSTGSGTPDTAFLRALAGKFIVFEGGDGSGKSTQLRSLVAALEAQAVPFIQTREPGGTPVGDKIREALLTRDIADMSVRCEMLLYMASRAELCERVIQPALRAGQLVLADRFVSSTLAYQGTAGGLPSADIAAVARVATRGLMPDLVVLFDIDTQAAARRLSPLLDRMEAKGIAFHAKVRQGYLDQARSDPRRFAVIDASQPPELVWRSLCQTLAQRTRDWATGS